MKIAVSAKGLELNSEVDKRFGRAENFVIIDSENRGDFYGIENAAKNALGGAGGEAVRILAKENVEIILTGEVGPKAFQALEGFEIKAFRGIEGTVQNAIDAWKENKLQEVELPSAKSHTGLNQK